MVKLLLVVFLLALLGVGYFLGEPNLKQTVARMSCDEFLTLKPVSAAWARGQVAMLVGGGSREMLAENCAVYPGKPMAFYFGWHQYLEQGE